MKTWMYLAAVLISGFANASEPANMCYDGCTAPQTRIWDAWQKSGPFVSDAVSPAVFSGECYHSGFGYDPEHAHHAVVYMDEVGGEPHFGARFSFFAESNPFASWSLADAARELPDFADDRHRMVVDGASGRADFSTKDKLWAYWLRPSSDAKTVYVIGYWSVTHPLYCELKRHE